MSQSELHDLRKNITNLHCNF